MDFLEWLVIDECSEKHIKNISFLQSLLNIVDEAAETTGFLEEKILLESKNKNKKNINESHWKQRLSKINWKNLIENEQEEYGNNDENDDENVELENPFSDDDTAKPVAGSVVDDDGSDSSIDSKLERLKKIKDAMLMLRWSAMKQRNDTIERLKSLDGQNKEEAVKLLGKLGYVDNTGDPNDIEDAEIKEMILRASMENDNNVPSSVEPLLTATNIRQASQDLSDLLYRTREDRSGNTRSSGLFKGAINKAKQKSRYSTEEIYSTFMFNLTRYLQEKGERGWKKLPEMRGGLYDLENDSEEVLKGISRYLAKMIITSPKEDSRIDALQNNPRRRAKKADGGFTSIRNKGAVVNSDISSKRFEFYLKLLDALRDVTSWDKTAEAKLKSISPDFYPDEGVKSEKGKYRKAVIADMFRAKLLPDPTADSERGIERLLSTYLAMIRNQNSSRSYRKVTHTSALVNNDSEGSAGDALDAAIYKQYVGGRDVDFAGAEDKDPAQLAMDRESGGPSDEFYDAFKKAMDALLVSNREVGLAYCLSKNLDCANGFPLADRIPDSLKKSPAKEVAARLNELLKPREPYTDEKVRRLIKSAKNYLMLYFNDNFPHISNKLAGLFSKE